MWLYRIGIVALVAASCLLFGCTNSNQPTVRLPALSPDTAGQQALAELDTDKDGFLDAKELEKCPSLKSALSFVDRDGDGKISAKEIADRLRFYQERKVAIIDVSCQVMMDTSVIAGATVTFTPEKWMGPDVKPATGVSDDTGLVSLKIESESLPGVNCGFYRVTVSKKDAQGKEAVPARYNTQTTLGFEVAPDMRDTNFLIKLSRR
jgi:EF hand domain-containing protein